MMLPVASIEVSESALRQAQTQSEKFEEVKRSIQKYGILENLTVRPSKTAEGMYTLIDGLQRLTIAKMLGLEEVPVYIMDVSEADALLLQIQTNLQSIDTKPAEYGKQLVRILRHEPDLTASKLAERLCKSPEWVNTRLGLAKLHTDIQKLVDDGTIVLANARMLSGLSPEDQANWVGRAVNETSDVFVPAISEFIKDSKKAAREGKAGVEEKFVPTARQRTKNELLVEIEKPVARNSILTKDMTPAQAWVEALKWSLRLDAGTLKEAEEKWNTEKEARETRKAEAQAAREAARAAKAAELEKQLI
jgi:ParB/RepB/Spo0J family partition protein